jgi:hypothetical protein
MNNYIENLKRYSKGTNFFEGEWNNFKAPFEKALSNKNNEKGILLWLKAIAKYHIDENTGSNYWIEKTKSEEITNEKIDKADSLDSLVSLLGNSDPNLLKKENGYRDYYMPKNFKIEDLFKSSSSGTTGPAKTVYHTPQSLYVSAVNEYTGIKAHYPVRKLKNKKLLAAGPVGAYQEEHKKLAELLGMEYVGNEFETKGLKLLSPQQMMEAMKPVMDKEVYILKNGNIGIATATMEMLAMMPKELFYGTDLIKVSGTQITVESLKKTEKEIGKKLIPMYGHYAGKSSIGFANDYNITYFTSFPITYIYMNNNGKALSYGEKAQTKMIIAEPELLLITDEDYARKTKTTKLTKAFKPLNGISDLSRS